VAHQAKQSLVELALIDEQGVAANLLDTEKNATLMKWAQRDRLPNEEIESAGKKLTLARPAPPKSVRSLCSLS
jgi:hypothetical protein